MALSISDLSVGGNIMFSGDVQKSPSNLARRITASGSASIEVSTDIAIIRMNCFNENENYETVHQILSSNAVEIVEFLQSKDIIKLSTNNFSIYPYYSYNPTTLKGYRGNYSILFECKIGDAGKIIDGAIKETEFTIQNISYKALEQNLRIAQKQALSAATLNAITSIEASLSETQYKMVEIYEINVQNGGYTTKTESADIAASESTPILGSDANVTANVIVKALFE